VSVHGAVLIAVKEKAIAVLFKDFRYAWKLVNRARKATLSATEGKSRLTEGG